MNYYERHLGDYAKDTAHLSMLEHGAYGLLLDRYYATEAGIPAAKAHRIARARGKEEMQAVDVVLEEFFTLVEGVWLNRRAEEEIARAQSKIRAAQENGKKGGRPKKQVLGSAGESGPQANVTEQKPTGLWAGSARVAVGISTGLPAGLATGSTQQTPPQTRPQAHQSPDTSHQPEDLAHAVGISARTGATTMGDAVAQRALELCVLLRQRGAAVVPGNPPLARWASEGVSDAQALQALELAQQAREHAASSQPITASYLDSILRNNVCADGSVRASPAQRPPTLHERRAATISALTTPDPSSDPNLDHSPTGASHERIYDADYRQLDI